MPALPGIEGSFSSYLGGQGAVEDVDTTAYPLDDVLRGPHPHQVPWLVLREPGYRFANYGVGQRLGFSQAQAADGITRKIQRVEEAS